MDTPLIIPITLEHLASRWRYEKISKGTIKEMELGLRYLETDQNKLDIIVHSSTRSILDWILRVRLP